MPLYSIRNAETNREIYALSAASMEAARAEFLEVVIVVEIGDDEEDDDTCPRCRKQLRDSEILCPHCGYDTSRP